MQKMMEKAIGPLKILFVEDEPLIQAVLSKVINRDPMLTLITIGNVSDAVTWLKACRPDVLFVDLFLPDCHGITVIKACVEHWRDCPILVLTSSSAESDILNCLKAGAGGYLQKDPYTYDNLIQAIYDLRAGGSPINPRTARKIVKSLCHEIYTPSKTDIDAGSLTNREIAVLYLIATGKTYREISQNLNIAHGTVQNHVKNIYNKLSVNSRSEATSEAYRLGVIRCRRKNEGDRKHVAENYKSDLKFN